jgi:hypothetical protein
MVIYYCIDPDLSREKKGQAEKGQDESLVTINRINMFINSLGSFISNPVQVIPETFDILRLHFPFIFGKEIAFPIPGGIP